MSETKTTMQILVQIGLLGFSLTRWNITPL